MSEIILVRKVKIKNGELKHGEARYMTEEQWKEGLRRGEDWRK